MQSSFPLHQECVNLIAEQVAHEYEASLAYRSLAFHFEHRDVAFFNVAKFFHHMSDEELSHAKKFQEYLVLRGERLNLRALNSFNTEKNITLQKAFELALEFENNVFKLLRNMHDAAEKLKDAHLAMFIEEVFFEEQIQSERELVGHLTMIKRLGNGVGEFLFDSSGLISK